MNSVLGSLARWAVRSVPGVRPLGRALLSAVQMPNTEIPEIQALLPIASASNTVRFNLLLPSLEQKHLFGGASTALQFFEALTAGHADARIVLMDTASVGGLAPVVLSRWPATNQLDKDQPGRWLQLMGTSSKKASLALAVRRNDIFVSTIWWSAYKAKAVLAWQAQHFDRPLGPLLSLIQDYEPGFYPWGSRYLLAQSTYHYAGALHAVINSQTLAAYLQARGYSFSSAQVFEMGLNAALCKAAFKQPQLSKEKVLLVYGRPAVERNAFALLVQSLRLWVQELPQAKNWQIISVGEAHPDIALGEGLQLRSLGKLSLEEYAQWLRRAAVGISLMVSPHPSYPPLEMAAFEIDVITLPFANKQMTEHPRWFAVREPLPELLARQLTACTQAFEIQSHRGSVQRTIDLTHPWLQQNEPFAFAPALAQRLMAQVAS